MSVVTVPYLSGSLMLLVAGLETGLLTVVALLTVVVVGLVRAQAATARRLDVVERRLLRAQRRSETRATAPDHHQNEGGTMTSSAPPAGGDDLVDVRGVTVDGEATAYALERPGPSTLVAFLSTTCGVCVGIWRQLRDEGLDGMPAVVVTKDADVERLAVAREMTQSGSLPVVMSSEAWDDYEVPGSPYFLVVGGDPREILAEGEAASWKAVRNLAHQSLG